MRCKYRSDAVIHVIPVLVVSRVLVVFDLFAFYYQNIDPLIESSIDSLNDCLTIDCPLTDRCFWCLVWSQHVVSCVIVAIKTIGNIMLVGMPSRLNHVLFTHSLIDQVTFLLNFMFAAIGCQLFKVNQS